MDEMRATLAIDAKILVVDDDQVARNIVVNALAAKGYLQVVAVADGLAAWQVLTGDPGFKAIVLDWKLPGLSGLTLFNRIRNLPHYRKVPLLVVSGFVGRSDFRLLQEFPCTSLLEKPFTNILLFNRLNELSAESLWYDQNEALLDSLFAAVKGDGKAAEQVLKQILKKAPKPLPLALLAAKQLVKARMLKSAKAVLESVLKLDDECVIALHEMGKVLHMLGQHDDALPYLRQATKLSPQNLQRICLIGEVELNRQNPAAASDLFTAALKADEDDKAALAGLTVAGNMTAFLGAPDAPQLKTSFASLMNTLGIAYVRSGDFARGLGQYEAALTFLATGEDRARVAFNMGLGLLRWGKPEAALVWFQRSEAEHQGSGNRSASYVRRLLLKEAAALTEQESPDVTVTADAVPDNVIPLPTPAATTQLPENESHGEARIQI